MILSIPWGDSSASAVSLCFDSVLQQTWISKEGSQADRELQIYRKCFPERLLAHEPEHLKLQFIKGQSLEQADLPFEAIASIFLSFVKELAVLHTADYLHCDIKPSNILINEVGKAHLIDFGFVVPNGYTSPTNPAGTMKYASPEQKGCRELSFASDVYSVGVVLQECLGKHDSSTYQKMLEGMLQEDPSQRMELDEVQERLEMILSEDFKPAWQENLFSLLHKAWLDNKQALVWAQWLFFVFPEDSRSLEAMQTSTITRSKSLPWKGIAVVVGLIFLISFVLWSLQKAPVKTAVPLRKSTSLVSKKIMVDASAKCDKIWLSGIRLMGTTLLLEKGKDYNVKCLTLQNSAIFYIVNTRGELVTWKVDETRSKK